MKKFLTLILAGAMILSLAGCGKSGIQNANAEWLEDDDIDSYELADGNMYYEGKEGSKMQTAWFTFTVNDAYYTDEELGGYSISDGCQLLVVNVTIKNTFEESIPMFDDDFAICWDEEDDDAYDYPIRTSSALVDDMLPEEYDLDVKESITGSLIFEVPEGSKDFALIFREYYEDETNGNLFWIYFTATAG